MLYDELKKLTKGEATVEEYNVVNKAYMESDNMTKEEAAEVWKKLYGKKHREIKRENARIDALCHDFDWVIKFIGFDEGHLMLPNNEVIQIVRDCIWDSSIISKIYHYDFHHGKRLIAKLNEWDRLKPIPKRYFRKNKLNEEDRLKPIPKDYFFTKNK